MLVDFLRDDGFAVSAALDGAHALRAAGAWGPDIVVLDLGLPVLDGSEFARRWRARTGNDRVPIVAVSGMPAGEETARQIGAVAFMRKPLDLVALAALLRQVRRPPAVRKEPTEEIA